MRFFITAALAAVAVASPVVERGLPSRNRPGTGTGTTPVNSPTPARPRSPPWASIVVASANGDGCPSGGSVTGVFSSYNTVLSLTYAAFKTIKTATTTYNDRNKQCSVSFRLNAPAGWSYTATTIYYTGHVRLPVPTENGNDPTLAPLACTANLTTSYRQAGFAPAAANTGGLFTWSSPMDTGLLDQDFNATSTLRTDYSPCTNGNAQAGPIFTVNTRAAVDCNGAPDQDGAILNIDTEDARVVSGIEFTWQQCAPGAQFPPQQQPPRTF